MTDDQDTERAIGVTEARIREIEDTITAVENDKKDAETRVELDKRGASANPGVPSSAETVLRSHIQRIDDLIEAKKIAEQYLKNLKAK